MDKNAANEPGEEVINWVEDDTVQEAIDAIKKVLNVHENHLYPGERTNLEAAIGSLEHLKAQGFD